MQATSQNQTVISFIEQLTSDEGNISFEHVMEVISVSYFYSPTTFHNGDLLNEAGTNEGSCKIFSFAKLNNFTEKQTLACFGRYYRDDVIKNPQGDDHGNIRNFIKTGWEGIKFESSALEALSAD